RPAGPGVVQDVRRGWKGSRVAGETDLEAVVAEIAAILARYGLYTVLGDRYAGKWIEQAFRRAGVRYEFAEIDKSKAYLELEPALAQGRVALLDHPDQARELRLLEKRYKPGGKTPTIDHPKGGHDDHANALALAVAKLTTSLAPAVGGTLESFALERGERAAAAAPEGAGFWGRLPAGLAGARRERTDAAPDDAPERR